MKLSIVTICYKDLAGLQKTYSSLSEVLNGLADEVEWLVVDGGSNDGTKEYLESIQPSKWVSKKDRGIYDAMNVGTSMASGIYVLYLNAGDLIYDPMKFITLVESLPLIPEIVFTGAYFESGGYRRYRKPRGFDSIWHSVPANHQSIFFPREAVVELGYSLEYKICGDYDLCCRLFMNNTHSKVIDQPTVIFELGGVSTNSIFLLANEALKIQRLTLKLSLFYRTVSYARRLAAMLVNYTIYLATKRH